MSNCDHPGRTGARSIYVSTLFVRNRARDEVIVSDTVPAQEAPTSRVQKKFMQQRGRYEARGTANAPERQSTSKQLAHDCNEFHSLSCMGRFHTLHSRPQPRLHRVHLFESSLGHSRTVNLSHSTPAVQTGAIAVVSDISAKRSEMSQAKSKSLCGETHDYAIVTYKIDSYHTVCYWRLR